MSLGYFVHPWLKYKKTIKSECFNLDLNLTTAVSSFQSIRFSIPNDNLYI